jgi:hypothetical protein
MSVEPSPGRCGLQGLWVGLGHARVVMGADENDQTALRFAKKLA